jgi:voltage-gated potassium channel
VAHAEWPLGAIGLMMSRALASPARNLIGGLIYVLVVMTVAVGGYVHAGWNVADSVYMTVTTIFTVGYGEVKPIDTPELRGITIALIMLGCTGMIFLTGSLVQLISASQFAGLLDQRRMNARISDLRGHVIICGFGRIGAMLSRELSAARMPFVVVEKSDANFAAAHDAGFLCLQADAVEEESLRRAGIEKARALATVLPDDAANVFITLSARSLNRGLTIIARGEMPATERKLLYAGADRVVMPAHIGAERIAQVILFGSTDGTLPPRQVEAELARFGLGIDMLVAEQGSAWAGLTVQEVERLAENAFLVIAVQRAGTGGRDRAQATTRIEAGDGIVVLSRSSGGAIAGFAAPAPSPG